MARITLVATLLGLGTFSAAKPVDVSGMVLLRGSLLRTRQDAPANNTDPVEWCENIDLNNPDLAVKVWEDWGVAIWMDTYLHSSISPADENWPYTLTAFSNPGNADAGVSVCAVRPYHLRRWSYPIYVTNSGCRVVELSKANVIRQSIAQTWYKLRTPLTALNTC